MMRLMKFLPVIFLLGIVTLIISCEDDKSTNPQEQAPTIPPGSTIMIDFSEFPDTNSIGSPDLLNLSKKNWGWAALNVSVWNSVLTLTLALPVAAFSEAFNHQPVLQSDGSWLWQYTVVSNEETITVKLFGMLVATGIEWRMAISTTTVTDFEWFTGFSNANTTEGNWTLNANSDPPVPVLYIEWHRDPQQGTAAVKYTNIAQGIAENGSYIHYGKTNDVPHNRFYQIYGSEEDRLIDILWNYEQHFGRVKDTVKFRNEDWQCWDEKLDDINCTE